MGNTALITGITGQDGALLSKLLVDKGYQVYGITRIDSNSDLNKLDFLRVKDPVKILWVDLTDTQAVMNLLEETKPTEIYNLAAQSSVSFSFKTPTETFNYNTQSVINLLEAIRGINKDIKFYQASSSEMFGNVSLSSLPIKESLLFHPVSPYGISKASAHWLTVNYREAYGLFTACGILFNHESALRGENFVIKKIINTALKIEAGESQELVLGNLAINRDWGYAPKYVEAIWLMLQNEVPEDYVICSKTVTSLQDIVIRVFDRLNLDLKTHLRLDQAHMRSIDLNVIYGDNAKAKDQLNWEYELSSDQLIDQLIADEREWIKWEKGNQG